MDNKHNSFSFYRGDYEEYYDVLNKKDYNYEAMYDDIKNFIRIAVKNNYQMKIWCDGETVVVEYNYKDDGMSGVSLEWLDENEYICNSEPDCSPEGAQAGAE